MSNPVAFRTGKRFASGAVAVVMLAGLCVGAWIAQAGDSPQSEEPPLRSFAQITDEIETARIAAESCRAIIDKPLHCLP